MIHLLSSAVFAHEGIISKGHAQTLWTEIKCMTTIIVFADLVLLIFLIFFYNFSLYFCVSILHNTKKVNYIIILEQKIV